MSAVECEHLFCGMDDISISKRNLFLLRSLQPNISKKKQPLFDVGLGREGAMLLLQ
jgi:hypothetical protein